MCRRTGPLVILSLSYDARSNGISFHIPHCVPKMPFIQNGGLESPLPQMAGFGMSEIEINPIAAMNTLKRTAQGILPFRNDDEMNMIVHQAIGPDSKGVFDALLDEHLHIGAAIDVIKEHIRFTVSALCHMVWVSSQCDTSRSRHGPSTK